MKKVLVLVLMVGVLLGFSDLASAYFGKIGTATYLGNSYNLIYEGELGGQGLVWLDYARGKFTWTAQKNWAAGLGAVLTVSLLPGYSSTINWTTGWRLPTTVDGPSGSLPFGWDGTTYTGYNITTSEMGHLYYSSLGNKGYYATDGTYPQPGWGLTNQDPFLNLLGNLNDFYWSETARTGTSSAWRFYLYNGSQDFYPTSTSTSYRALAVHSGEVAAVPIPPTVWLLGSGLIGLVGLRRGFKKYTNK